MPDDSTIEIPLTRGRVTLIDAADWPIVAPYKWHATFQKTRWYAQTNLPGSNGRRQTVITMHRLLLGFPKENIDHIRGDGLDNRRANLRLATHMQNMQNRGPAKTNTTGFKGVYWHAESHKFRAMIGLGGKLIHIGLFGDADAAAHAYDAAAIQMHGEFARLNFPE